VNSHLARRLQSKADGDGCIPCLGGGNAFAVDDDTQSPPAAAGRGNQDLVSPVRRGMRSSAVEDDNHYLIITLDFKCQ
jgi:hypothetical protein